MSTKGGASTELKLFTVEEARKMLPLVRQIVTEIVDGYKYLRTRIDALNALMEKEPKEKSRDERKLQRNLEEEIAAVEQRMNASVQELAGLGVEFKDYTLGLVDFPTRINNEIAYLCWKLDEEEIQYWHTLDSGYAGRKKIRS